MMLYVTILCIIGAILAGLISPAVAEDCPASYTHYRLPHYIRPINYNLTLMIDIEKDTFEGWVEIQILVTAPTSMIVIHAQNLTFVEAFLYYYETDEGSEVILDHSYSEYEYWILKLQNNIEPGIYYLGIKYKGQYKGQHMDYYERDHGLFKLIGSNNIVANTHGAKARTILPCFDEPALKATFDVTVVKAHMYAYYALSNMDIKDVINHGSFRTTIFKRTLPMSTGSFGLIVTDLPYKSVNVYQEGLGDPYELRMYGTYRMDYNDSLLYYIKDTLEFLAEYTNIPYRLPKFDVVAPKSLEINKPTPGSWGMCLLNNLYDDSAPFPLDTWNSRKMSAVLGGQWFGHLVNPNWWGERWLTTAFSTFIGWKAMMTVYPNATERVPDYEAYYIIQSGMAPEGKSLLRKTRMPILGWDWDVAIDGYAKGFGLLMMIEHVIGEYNFKKAVSSYLKKQMYGTVTTSDLIEELLDVYPNIHLENMIKSFSTNYNFPLVTLEKHDDGSYKLKQTAYRENLIENNDDQEQQLWTIPVMIQTAENTDVIWLDKSEYVIPNLEADWAVISARGFGYYRTNYNENLWLALANALLEDVEALNYLDRINLLRSFYNQIPNLNEYVAFKMFRFLEEETNWLVRREGSQIRDNIKWSVKYREYPVWILGVLSKSLK